MSNINTNFRDAYTNLTTKVNFYDEKIDLYYNNTHPDSITTEGVKDLVSLRRQRGMYAKLQNILLERFGKEIEGDNHV